MATKSEVESFCNLICIDKITSIFEFNLNDNTLLIIQHSTEFEFRRVRLRLEFLSKCRDIRSLLVLYQCKSFNSARNGRRVSRGYSTI